MSVVNQMLNGLEQRGVRFAAEQVRPVREARAYHKRRIALLLLVALLAAIAVMFKRGAATPPVVIAAPAAVVAEVRPVLIKDQFKPPLQPMPEPNSQKVTNGHGAAHDNESRHASFPLLGSSLRSPLPHAGEEANESLRELHVNEARHVTPPRAAAATARIAPHSQLLVQNTPLPVASPAEPLKQVSPAQQADALFRKAAAFMQQGRASDAMAGFEAALALDVGHDAARQALVALLLEGKKGNEAEQVLQAGLKNNPANGGFAMLLARLQVARGELDQAITTLELTLPYAVQQPDYQAFYAALLQRKSRHGEAAEHYQIALQAVPNKAVWLMGYGISLQALARTDEAKEAYRRALDSKTLSPELQAFVQQKIKAL